MKTPLLFALALISAGSARADSVRADWTAARPDGHGPIGVMGDHTHEKGEVMLAYRYQHMLMKDLRQNGNDISRAEALGAYMMVPVEMKMDMHMVSAMWALSDDVTFMGMLSYKLLSMDMATSSGALTTTESKGFGDVPLSAMWTVWRGGPSKIHLNLGVSVPTGSIHKRGETPMGVDQKLPYPMQLGSGTWDLHPGFTYLGECEVHSWGAQVLGVLRPGANSNHYHLGNQLTANTWMARRWAPRVSTSLRLEGNLTGQVSDADPELNSAMAPTANPVSQGGRTLKGYLGVNYYVDQGSWKGFRLAGEFGIPLMQNLNGTQLKTKFEFTLGAQYAY
jgi:hypothetical protein